MTTAISTGPFHPAWVPAQMARCTPCGSRKHPLLNLSLISAIWNTAPESTEYGPIPEISLPANPGVPWVPGWPWMSAPPTRRFWPGPAEIPWPVSPNHSKCGLPGKARPLPLQTRKFRGQNLLSGPGPIPLTPWFTWSLIFHRLVWRGWKSLTLAADGCPALWMGPALPASTPPPGTERMPPTKINPAASILPA